MNYKFVLFVLSVLFVLFFLFVLTCGKSFKSCRSSGRGLPSICSIKYDSRARSHCKRNLGSIYPKLIYRNEPYASYDFDHAQELTFDFYRPSGVEASQKLPLIVFVHSGGFFTGDKRNAVVLRYCEDFCRSGKFATATVNYRLLTLNFTIHPQSYLRQHIYEAVGDVWEALNYFKEHAEDLAIDTSNIFLVGISAGGVIANELVFTRQQEALDFIQDAGRLYRPDNIDALGGDISSLLRGVVSLGGAALNYAHVESEEGNALPMLFIHGAHDKIVPFFKGRPFKRYEDGDVKLTVGDFLFNLGVKKENNGKPEQDVKLKTSWSAGIRIRRGPLVHLVRRVLTWELCGPECIVDQRLNNQPDNIHLLKIEDGPHLFMLNDDGRFNCSYYESMDYIYRFVEQYLYKDTNLSEEDGRDESERRRRRRRRRE